jgi:hypothetical protein
MKFFSNLYRITLLATFSTALISCEDEMAEPEIDPSQTGAVELKFDNVFGSADLQLNTNYTNSTDETYDIKTLKYFVSNFVFRTEDGREYVVPQLDSYQLIDEANAASQKFTFENLPEGNYNEVSFIVGVDSLRSTMGPDERTGVLDQGAGGAAADMYWTWNSGYIFFKMEGTSPQVNNGSDQAPQDMYFYHIGGFGGYDKDSPTLNNIREVTIKINGSSAQVRSNETPSMHITADISRVFNGGTTQVSLAENPVVMANPFSPKVADNYTGMFMIHHVHNDEHNHGSM